MDFQLCKTTTKEELKNFDREKYKANIKFDGERIIAFVDKGEVSLLNRRQNIKTSNYKEVVNALKDFPDCILDGEVISLDDNFDKLQKRALTTNKFKQKNLEKTIPVKYMVFDIIKINDKYLGCEILKDRIKEFENLEKNDVINFAEYGDLDLMFEKAKDREGIVIKNMSGYYSGKRTSNWLKLKNFKETELTLTTYTINNAGIRGEDIDGNKVQIAGKQHTEVKNKIDDLGYCEVNIQYLSKTKEGRFRFPSYRGLKETETLIKG